MNLSLDFADINGIKLAYFKSEVVSQADQTILCVHGLGCHGRMWDTSLKDLSASIPSFCIELRGHGRSEKRGPYSWSQFGRDICSFIQKLDLKSIVGVGHSMGGHLLLQAAATLSDRFDGLVLLDPVVFQPRAYLNPRHTKIFHSPDEHPYARRKYLWNSADEWFDAIKNRDPFKLWNSEVLRNHCDFGLEPVLKNQYQLCCPPLVEAEASLNSNDTNIHPMLGMVNVPVTVLRAKTAPGFRHPLDNLHSTTWPRLAERLPQGIDKHMPDLTHFIPMQRPDIVGQEVRAHLSD
ncbi:MAG: alpha/beta hydrolase [Gammaproteobacteria bacterium]|nr:alpha/beta hydrolase [Gammaproteobacteria bacterium]